MTIFTPSRPTFRGGDTASGSLGKPGVAGARWLDWLSKKLFDVDALDLELTREDLPNAPDDDVEASTDLGATRAEVES
jgi:hypothetical protein